MKKIITSALVTVTAICSIAFTDIGHAQVPPPTPLPDLSMLTNHAALVAYALKQVSGITANVYSGSEVTDQGQRFYSYTNQVKSLDGISAILTNDYWDLEVTSPTDYFTLSVTFYNTNDQSIISSNQNYDNNSSQLFSGAMSSQPVKGPYGQWELPLAGEEVPMYLAYMIKIKVPGLILNSVRLIARDAYGNPYPVDMPVDSDGFFFYSQYAGNGTLVMSGYQQTGPNTYQWFQNAFALASGSPAQLTYVEAQVLVQGSGDIVSYKDATILTNIVWTYTDYQGNEYGSVPLEVATFTKPTTNVLLSTYTSATGHAATVYSLENQATKQKISITVPPGAASVTTGTNVLNGVYYIIPYGINLQNNGGYYGGATVVGGKG